MQRITGLDTVTARPTPSTGGMPGYFSDGNAVTGQDGTALNQDFYNDIQETVCNPIETSGQNLQSGKDDQLTWAIKRLSMVSTWDANFVAAFGGYPFGAHVLDSSGGEWISNAANNKTMPGAANASWWKISDTYAAATALAALQNLIASVQSTLTSIDQRYFTNISNTIIVPVWAKRMRYIIVGGGGAGSTAQGRSESDSIWGAGGGSGGYVEDIVPVAAGKQVQITVGTGGPSPQNTVGAQNNGGNTDIYHDGNHIATAGGGWGGSWTSGSQVNAAGGQGGQTFLYITNSPNAVGGNCGSDGQAYKVLQGGNGAPGPWGGAGRAGDGAGVAGSGPGAGGGAAYDTAFSGTKYYGGAGGNGCAIVEWLP